MARKPHLRLVVPEPEPDPDYKPPESIDDYRTPAPDDGYGKFPSTPVQDMQRRKGLGALRKLHRHRFVNEPFEMWLEGLGVDSRKLYSPHVLGWKVTFTVDEDIVFKVKFGAFPCIHPHGETKKQTAKRRDSFNRKRKREGKMHLETIAGTAARRPAPPVTRIQALLNKLPAPPGTITIPELAKKLRPHKAWRDANGIMRTLTVIEHDIRTLRRVGHPEIGCKLGYPGTKTLTWLLWRRRS
jgi:hypothetical protein